MWLVVGLGNPGEEYAKTRHNVGFMVIDELQKRFGGDRPFANNFNGQFAKVTLAGHSILLLKPQTFMNRSGQSVQPAAAFHKIPPGRIIVIHDDLDLPLGTIRVKKSGGHGGHNGLKDITQCIGEDYYRIRMGIGRPVIKGNEAHYVLSSYNKSEQASLFDQIDFACSATESLVHKGLEEAQMAFNRKN